MGTKQHFLWLLLCSLCFVACRQDLEDEALIEAPRVEHSELRSMQALFESRYKTESLRSFEAKGELDFSELEVNWEHPVRDTLEGHIETTALTINLKDFRLPTSQTFERSDVDRFRGLVSVPRLYHYKDLRSGKEYFAVVVTQPTKDWLEGHGIEEVYQSVRVPASFEGQLDVYSVDKKPLLRYVYREGRGVALHRAMSARSREQARVSKMICIYGITGYTHRQEVLSSDSPFSGTITGGYTIADVVVVDIKVPEYGYTCTYYPSPFWDRNVLEQILEIGITDDDFNRIGDYIPEILGGGTYDSAESTKRERLKQKILQDCLDFKKILDENSELSKKVIEINDCRLAADPLKQTEMGYGETSDGRFLMLKPEGRNSLDFESALAGVQVKGVIHSHIKNTDFIDEHTGDTVKERPIQIFSDSDLAHFFRLVGKSLGSTSISPSDVYHILVAEKYAYRLKVHGEKEEMVSKISTLAQGYAAAQKEIKRLLGVKQIGIAVEYSNLDSLYGSFVSILVKHQQLDGLVVQRINLETKEVNTVGFSVPERSQSNRSSVDISFEKLISDC